MPPPTISQLIARHAPTEGKQPLSGDVTGICYICALPTEQGQRRPPSDVFTAWAACAQGDVLCPDCAATLNYRDVRMFSWLATEEAFRVNGRGDRDWLWDVLGDPPEPPYGLYISKGGQKQGWISGVRQVATSRATIPVLTDWTDRPVMLRRADWETYAPLVVTLRAKGVSKQALMTGDYTANQWAKAIRDDYADALRQAQQYAGDPRWEIVCYASRKPDDSGDTAEPKPVATGTGGAYRPLGLDLPGR